VSVRLSWEPTPLVRLPVSWKHGNAVVARFQFKYIEGVVPMKTPDFSDAEYVAKEILSANPEEVFSGERLREVVAKVDPGLVAAVVNLVAALSRAIIDEFATPEDVPPRTRASLALLVEVVMRLNEQMVDAADTVTAETKAADLVLSGWGA
jgi:hypothetical protein